MIRKRFSMVKVITLATAIFSVSLPVMATGGKGMTWGFRHMSFDDTPHEGYFAGVNAIPPPNVNARTSANNSGIQKRAMMVGCGSNAGSTTYTRCNAYQGDTSCSTALPILCVKTSGNYKGRPPYVITSDRPFYSGWVGHMMKLTNPKLGTQLTSPQVADQLCGNGWVMAEHHMGKWISGMDSNNHHASNGWNVNNARSGGWGFHARFQQINNANKKNLMRTSRFWVKINGQPANCWNP